MEVTGKRCVAYCRVSTDKDDQQNSLNNQRMHYDEQFNKPGFTRAKVGKFYRKDGKSEALIPGIYADEGISGTSLKNRFAFQQMMEDAKNRKFDIIYVKNVARFARSVEDLSKCVKDLKEWGVAVYFEEANINTLEDGGIVLNVLAALAQGESEAKSTAVKFGIRRAQKDGKFPTGMPYGYNKKGGYLEVNPKEAKVITLIYDYYLQGYGVAKIARKLNTDEIPTKKGLQWSQMQISTILTNPLYIGRQISHKEETFDVNRHTRKAVDQDDWIIKDMPHLQIIDTETFNAVQAEYQRRRSLLAENYRYSAGHLLSNLIYCACGSNMKYKKRKTYKNRDIGYELTCQYRDMYGKKKCQYELRNALPEEVILEKVKAKIELIKNYDMSDLFDIYCSVKFNFDTSSERVAVLEQQRDELTRSIDNLIRLLSLGKIDEKEYDRNRKGWKDDLDKVENELNIIAHIDDERVAAKAQYRNFIKYLAGIDTSKLTNQELRNIFRKITVSSLYNPKGAIKGVKIIDYDYVFIDIPAKELIELVKGHAGKWSAFGKKSLDVFSDMVVDNKYSEIDDL